MGHEAGLGVYKRLLTDALLHFLDDRPPEDVLMLSAGVGRYMEAHCEYVGVSPVPAGENMKRFWHFIDRPDAPHHIGTMTVYDSELGIYMPTERTIFMMPLHVRNRLRRSGIEFSDYPDQRDGNPRSPEEVGMLLPYYTPALVSTE